MTNYYDFRDWECITKHEKSKPSGNNHGTSYWRRGKRGKVTLIGKHTDYDIFNETQIDNPSVEALNTCLFEHILKREIKFPTMKFRGLSPSQCKGGKDKSVVFLYTIEGKPLKKFTNESFRTFLKLYNATCEKIGFSHNDLHFGNIVADKTKITLIDYGRSHVFALKDHRLSDLHACFQFMPPDTWSKTYHQVVVSSDRIRTIIPTPLRVRGSKSNKYYNHIFDMITACMHMYMDYEKDSQPESPFRMVKRENENGNENENENREEVLQVNRNFVLPKTMTYMRPHFRLLVLYVTLYQNLYGFRLPKELGIGHANMVFGSRVKRIHFFRVITCEEEEGAIPLKFTPEFLKGVMADAFGDLQSFHRLVLSFYLLELARHYPVAFQENHTQFVIRLVQLCLGESLEFYAIDDKVPKEIREIPYTALEYYDRMALDAGLELDHESLLEYVLNHPAFSALECAKAMVEKMK